MASDQSHAACTCDPEYIEALRVVAERAEKLIGYVPTHGATIRAGYGVARENLRDALDHLAEARHA